MTPQEAGAALAAHQISYDDYLAAVDAYNAVPGGAQPPAPGPAANEPTQAPREGEGFTPPTLPEPEGLTPNAKDRADIARGDAANAKLSDQAAQERDLRRRQTMAIRQAGASAFSLDESGDPKPLPRDMQSPPVPTDQRIVAGPGGARPGPASGVNPDDARLDRFIQQPPAAGGPAHAVGLSPADRDYLASLQDQGHALTQNIGAAVNQHQQLVDDFGRQTEALAEDSRIAALTFAQSQKEDAAHRAELQAKTDEAQKKIDAHIAELQSQGIDPNRYWANTSTGTKIAAAIAVGLGQVGTALVHAPNVALGIINDAITRDIDAQKANLAKGLELAKLSGQSLGARFDHEKALLDAERESTQVAYATASNDVAKRAAMFAGNADFAQKAAALQAQLADAAAQRVGAINDKIYALNKAGERVVGGGGGVDLRKQVIKRAQDLTDKFGLPPVEARRKAAEEYGLLPAGASGSDPLVKAGSGGKPNERARESDLAHQNAIANIDALLALRDRHSGGTLSPEDRAKGVALAARTQEQLVAALGKTNQGLLDRTSHLIPDDPLEMRASGLVGSDTIGVSLRTARQMLQDELARSRANHSARDEPAATADPGEEEDEK